MKYEIADKIERPQQGSNKVWQYRVINDQNAEKFKFTILISTAAIAAPGNITDVQEAVKSDGRSWVERWFRKLIREDRVAMVETTGIKDFTAPEWEVYWKDKNR